MGARTLNAASPQPACGQSPEGFTSPPKAIGSRWMLGGEMSPGPRSPRQGAALSATAPQVIPCQCAFGGGPGPAQGHGPFFPHGGGTGSHTPPLMGGACGSSASAPPGQPPMGPPTPNGSRRFLVATPPAPAPAPGATGFPQALPPPHGSPQLPPGAPGGPPMLPQPPQLHAPAVGCGMHLMPGGGPMCGGGGPGTPMASGPGTPRMMQHPMVPPSPMARGPVPTWAAAGPNTAMLAAGSLSAPAGQAPPAEGGYPAFSPPANILGSLRGFPQPGMQPFVS